MAEDGAPRSYERVALVLQGGGALGAYQVGVYQALEEQGFQPDWVAGTSIGAVTAAIIAGNPPQNRLVKLRQFWEEITRRPLWRWRPQPPIARAVQNLLSSLESVLWGQPGFFQPRPISPWLMPRGSQSALSYYDPAPLRRTLGRLVDFDWINAGHTRLSLGAVNVATGRQRYFDSSKDVIRMEHVVASAALPPVFPPVEVDGEYYWDGGVESNTPLNVVLEDTPRVDTLCFIVNLWNRTAPPPQSMEEVETRHKDITYASRADISVAHYKEKHDLRRMIDALCRRLPEEARDDPEVQAMWNHGCTTTMNIVRVAYQAKGYQGEWKDYEFSRASIHEHLRAGYEDTALRCQRLRQLVLQPDTRIPVGVFIHDLTGPQSQDEMRQQIPGGPSPLAEARSVTDPDRRRGNGG